MKTIYFAVTNDLCFDQRMHRICNSLACEGYTVWLIGRRLPGSPPVSGHRFLHHRIPCFFRKGKAFYLEYSLRLCWLLLRRRMDLVCAVDLDTILPVYLASVIKRIPRVYDAHELFTEMKEVVTRPAIHRAWHFLERWLVPRFPNGYTVSEPIAAYFLNRYGCHYAVIPNYPERKSWPAAASQEKIILYQGAVNEGRCFEQLIPAMREVDAVLHIYGNGNFLDKAKDLAIAQGLQDKVVFHAPLLPETLARITPKARIGITLFEDRGLSNHFSLANRFFDYMQAGLPQVCSNLPVYRVYQEKAPVAVLVDDHSPQGIARALNNLLRNEVLYYELRSNCMKTAQTYTWDAASPRLIELYKNLLP
jgi:glycosyltransferase involved in cell wall biosynthesis